MQLCKLFVIRCVVGPIVKYGCAILIICNIHKINGVGGLLAIT